jgi:hypothetical protein
MARKSKSKGKGKGCRKTSVYCKVKGAIRKVKGYKKKSCLK